MFKFTVTERTSESVFLVVFKICPLRTVLVFFECHEAVDRLTKLVLVSLLQVAKRCLITVEMFHKK
jgi:hypothetical protein